MLSQYVGWFPHGAWFLQPIDDNALFLAIILSQVYCAHITSIKFYLSCIAYTIAYIIDIKNLFIDINKLIFDIKNLFFDIKNWFIDIKNSFINIKNSLYFYK